MALLRSSVSDLFGVYLQIGSERSLDVRTISLNARQPTLASYDKQEAPLKCKLLAPIKWRINVRDGIPFAKLANNEILRGTIARINVRIFGSSPVEAKIPFQFRSRDSMHPFRESLRIREAADVLKYRRNSTATRVFPASGGVCSR